MSRRVSRMSRENDEPQIEEDNMDDPDRGRKNTRWIFTFHNGRMNNTSLEVKSGSFRDQSRYRFVADSPEQYDFFRNI